MDSPSVPFLVAIAFGLCMVAVRRARVRGAIERGEEHACWIVLGVLAGWVLASAILAARGVYLHPQALRFLPLLCGFLVPTALVAGCVWRWPTFRRAIARVLASLPLAWLVAVQAIRLTAIGTILQYASGKLPAHFILPVAVPDFLVGATALPMAVLAARNPDRARRGLVAWNLAGSSIFLLAGLLLHVSMPGPIQLFSSGPTTESVFRFPLALVPTFLVPFFVGVHGACLWRLYRRAA